MSNYIRTAIYTKLEADATLLALLGSTTDSMIGDREATSATLDPFLVVSSRGGRNTVHLGYQDWAIYCHHDKDPNTAAKILKLVKEDLNEQTLSVASDGGIACMGCQFITYLPGGYDNLTRKDVEGILVRVYVRDI